MTRAIGMPEAYNALSDDARYDYWDRRNALVDKVRAAPFDIADYCSKGWDVPGAAERRATYRTALDGLKAFDDAHGGAPVL